MTDNNADINEEYKKKTNLLIGRYFDTEDENERKQIASDIVELNFGLICKIVYNEWGWYDELDELIDIACMAVLEKIDRFKPERNVPFWNYISRYIRQYVFIYLASNDMHSYDIGLRINKIKKCVEKYFPDYVSKPEILSQIASQIADKINCTEFEVRSAIDAINKSNRASLDALSDMVTDEYQPEKHALMYEDIEELAEVLSEFSEEDRQLVCCIYENCIDDVDEVNKRLGTDYTEKELRGRTLRIKNMIRSRYRKKKINAVRESDKENNVHKNNPDLIMDIIDGISNI